MRYRVAAVGALKRGFIADGCAFYADRLGRLATLDVIEIRERGGSSEQQRSRAADELLRATEGTHRVALDERGSMFTSEGLASRIGQLEQRGVSRISVLIGGADGHTSDLHNEADEAWSLSDLTFPHELARLILLEQLYRAETIRAGHPYHRS